MLTPKQADQMLFCKGHFQQRLRLCNCRSCQAHYPCSKNRTSRARILDIRQHKDFETEHIRRSLNSPLKNLTPMVQDLFGNPDALHILWKGLKTKFDDGEGILGSKNLSMNILCYDGDASQLATSLLRAKGYTAFRVRGGFPALKELAVSRR